MQSSEIVKKVLHKKLPRNIFNKNDSTLFIVQITFLT